MKPLSLTVTRARLSLLSARTIPEAREGRDSRNDGELHPQSQTNDEQYHGRVRPWLPAMFRGNLEIDSLAAESRS